MLRAPWECFDDAGFTHSGQTLVEPELPLSPGKRRELLHERRKAELSRAWLSPVRAPWGQAGGGATPQWPQTFAVEPILGPVATVMLPPGDNPAKGLGAVTPDEIERVRAEQRRDFAERLAQQWRWNIAHL